MLHRSLRWLNFKRLRGGEKTLKDIFDEQEGEPPRRCFGRCKGKRADALDIKAEDVGRIRASEDIDEPQRRQTILLISSGSFCWAVSAATTGR